MREVHYKRRSLLRELTVKTREAGKSIRPRDHFAQQAEPFVARYSGHVRRSTHDAAAGRSSVCCRQTRRKLFGYQQACNNKAPPYCEGILYLRREQKNTDLKT